MKILFVISTVGTGKGGHFHSLNHISKELSKVHECKILTVGPGLSPVIEKNPLFFMNSRLNGFNYLCFLRQIRDILNKESPDIINFFDIFSYNILRFSINLTKFKICLTKCGGKNPIWYPSVKNIILFSKENLKWFHKRRKFKNVNIELIPNRISSLKLNQEYRPFQKVARDFNFIRICRIGKTYKKSIEDSIHLIKMLHAVNYSNVNLYIIGYIEDIDIYKQLIEFSKDTADFIHFITTPELTEEASKMLYLADAIIGTGRGVMEGASLSIPLLTINKEDDLPILIDCSNFDELFENNFSQRSSVRNFNKIENFDNIKKMLNDKTYYDKLSLFSNSLFKKHFSIEKINDVYFSFFKKAKLGVKRSLIDILFAIRHIILFIRLSNKRDWV